MLTFYETIIYEHKQNIIDGFTKKYRDIMNEKTKSHGDE